MLVDQLKMLWIVPTWKFPPPDSLVGYRPRLVSHAHSDQGTHFSAIRNVFFCQILSKDIPIYVIKEESSSSLLDKF